MQQQQLQQQTVLYTATGRRHSSAEHLKLHFDATLAPSAKKADVTFAFGSGLATPPMESDDEESLGRISRLPSMMATPESMVPFTKVHGNVLVMGVGYVGTHLVERFSSAYNVTAFDVSADRCAFLTHEFRSIDTITVTNSLPVDQQFDMCLISVPTLLNEDKTHINTHHIQSAVAQVTRIARPGMTVVIESSVTVGMTRALLTPLREKGVFVGFSPERVDPGRTFPAFKDIPKVISGYDEASLQAVLSLYGHCFETLVPVSSLECAEFCKLMENCQRLMLISYINEIADACQAHNVNVFEVCQASATKPFGYSPFTPSLGAGGHCIPVNPYYLFANNDLPLLRQAAEANEQRPVHKANAIYMQAKQLAASRAFASDMDTVPKILIVGMGFKKGQASLAYAPTVTLANTLQQNGAHVFYCDDYVHDSRWTKVDSDMLNKREGNGFDLYDAVIVAQSPEFAMRTLLKNTKHASVHWFSA